MKLTLFFILLTIAFGRCSSITPQTDAALSDSLTIRSGTSFGMCVGYCVNDYVVSSTTITLSQRSNISQAQQYPTRTCQATLSQSDWNTLKSLSNWDAFSKQPTKLDCPDCADGGAEYVELQMGDRKHRVTFETAKTIPGFEPLVDALRRQRTAFKDCK